MSWSINQTPINGYPKTISELPVLNNQQRTPVSSRSSRPGPAVTTVKPPENHVPCNCSKITAEVPANQFTMSIPFPLKGQQVPNIVVSWPSPHGEAPVVIESKSNDLPMYSDIENETDVTIKKKGFFKRLFCFSRS